MKKFSRGFTLIELLVVIAIIGILASVVLVSLNSARAKGQDAKVQSELNSLRVQAELYYNDNGNSYNNLFTGNNTWASANTNTDTILDSIDTSITTHTAGSDADQWAAQARLPSSVGGTAAYWCVDSTGVAKKVAGAMAAGAVVCPAS